MKSEYSKYQYYLYTKTNNSCLNANKIARDLYHKNKEKRSAYRKERYQQNVLQRRIFQNFYYLFRKDDFVMMRKARRESKHESIRSKEKLDYIDRRAIILANARSRYHVRKLDPSFYKKRKEEARLKRENNKIKLRLYGQFRYLAGFDRKGIKDV